jgi:hypothetical protein
MLKSRLIHFPSGIVTILALYSYFVCPCLTIAKITDTEKLIINVVRLKNNPIITPEMLPGDEGKNINGPSLIKVPEWVEEPLGKYYLYFAHHHGKYIRMAFADCLEGPWTIHKPGVLRIEDTMFFSESKNAHIASPDVHVDYENREIRMYFHGTCRKVSDCPPFGQDSCFALSKDGLSFKASREIMGDIYFRVFKWKEGYYAFTRLGVLYKSQDKNGLRYFVKPRQSSHFPGIGKDAEMRHLAVKVDKDYLYVFYSCIEHKPERILVSVIELSDDWVLNWRPSHPLEVLRPEMDYEGAKLPLEISEDGAALKPVHEIRDPYIFTENGQDYLIYSVAGESGIAIAKLSLRWK